MSFSSLIPSFLPGGISSRFDFQALLDHRGRLLQIHTALPALALIPERMVMREAVSQPFELVIDCLSTSAHFELKQLVGEQVSVALLQPSGQYKPWHGYVFEAAQLGSDGALARYRLVLRPWLSLLEQRLDAFVYQDRTALEIIEDIFADYPEAQYRLEVTEPLRRRSLCTQYRESDLAFMQRLLAEEGLSYHFEHAGDAAELAGATSALHTLVITDRAAPRVDLGDTRFTAQHATAQIQGQKDAVTAFKTQRRLQPNAVALGSWNYRELAGSSATLATALEQGDLPTLEVYDGSGAYRYENTAHAQRATELALGALELQVKTFEGQGSTRHFEAGRQFSLIDHPLYGAGLTEGLGSVIKAVLDAPASLLGGREDNRFTILAVEHHAANNLGSEAAALLGLSAIERGSYRNQFHAAPAAAPVIPRFARKPTAPGAQTALVVGLEGEALTTDRDHRVKIQFPWQRGANPVAGGLAHDSHSPDTQGNAPGNEQSGTWVRVMSPQAGANWGAMFTPRIGTEVLVEFIEGDIDRPVITAALYNGQDRPPFSAGVDSGVNHPGTLSGIHSHSLDQSGFNQWVLDDATAQVRMRLLCSYSAAEVGLGHLIQQAAHTAQRGAWRGSGFEAATRAWASLRSAKGMLISTTARPGSYGSAQSTQMDATEAVAQLKGAQDLADRLSQAAQTGQAQALTAHAESIPALIKTLDPEQDGKLTQAVNGQEAQKAQGRDLSDPVEAPATPTILLDTPSSQAWLSDASIASYAGQDLARVAQGDQHETAAHTHATVAGQTVSLYTHAGGITAHAANGPVSLRAHTDELQILADQDVTILSVNGEIHINAQSKIELIGADSGVILEGGDITFVTPGTWEAKGAAQAMLGGSSASVASLALPQSQPVETMAALNEVAAIELVTALDEGSANDGTGANFRKAMVYGKDYAFKVKAFESQAPVSPASIQWRASGTSPDGKVFDLAIKGSGQTATLTLKEVELCGTDITVRAFIQSANSGASATVPVHCRFRWFDGGRIKTQAAQRVAEPWRIDQGASSLCGMAALFYLMAQNKPGPYQTLAAELHRKGQLQIGDYLVKPHSAAEDTMYELKPSDDRFKNLKMFEVDWIVLAVSRSSESSLAFDGLGTGGTDQLKSVNWPGLMEDLTKNIGGFEKVESIDTSILGVVRKKSILGQVHDLFSDSDIDSLIEIDKLHQSGKKIMLMIDYRMLTREASYSILDALSSHWIAYEGNLKMFDADGKFTNVVTDVATIAFSAYSYGASPFTSEKYNVRGEREVFTLMSDFHLRGISPKTWKSNYYGYIAAE